MPTARERCRQTFSKVDIVIPFMCSAHDAPYSYFALNHFSLATEDRSARNPLPLSDKWVPGETYEWEPQSNNAEAVCRENGFSSTIASKGSATEMSIAATRCYTVCSQLLTSLSNAPRRLRRDWNLCFFVITTPRADH